MDIEEFFKKRLLRRIPIDKQKVRNSIKIAQDKLDRAKKLFSKDFFPESFVSAYTSIFHASRALLYSEGIQEKSHFATYFYIKEKYYGKISGHLIEAFKNYQLERHNIFYGFEIDVNSKKAEGIILDAEDFIEEIKAILQNEK
jgi:uncharacterized protein (UPF0332 family)